MSTRRFISIFLIAVFAPLSLLAGCSNGPDAVDLAGGTPSSFVAIAPTDSPATAGAAAEYLLSPGDLLDISVFQVPDLTKEVQIDATGEISLPLIGGIKAAGETTHSLETELAGKLKAKYLQSPQVSVFLKQSAGEHVTVTGQVIKPGDYPIAGKMTLVQALAQAGDFNTLGDPGSVTVYRQANGSRVAAKFNVDDIRAGKAADPELYPGDMVMVNTSTSRSVLQTFEAIASPIGVAGSVAVTAAK